MTAAAAPNAAETGRPRIGPGRARYSLVNELWSAADELGLELYPWQDYAADVAMSVHPDERWLYREVAIIGSRQNGKTKILLPRIKWAIENGRRVIHTAQNGKLPRGVFLQLARHYRGEPEAYIRRANGQEEITLPNGGSYLTIAPQRGARGLSADDLIVDELREMEDFEFVAAAEPTLAESDNPQVIYLSNAGTRKSVVLNDLTERAGHDPNLAYLEWSAAPELATEDRAGWLQANPIIGYGRLTLERLAQLHDKYRAAGELSIFETEHLCRQVPDMAPSIVSGILWQRARGQVQWPPTRPVLGISVDPGGARASAAVAWRQPDGRIGLTIAADVDGEPVDQTALGVALLGKHAELRIVNVAYDPWTDQHLARHFLKARPVQSAEFANACERFAGLVETGGLVHQWSERLSEELPHASRRVTTSKAWIADRAGARPITTVLAAIRAVWLASEPSAAVGQIY